ncbi:MAG TPA: hypothetical protein DE042_02385 [Colwellia sp.]|nr:hypothetical protein [Colwellia sp.]
MALYSWFSKNNKPNKKRVMDNNYLLKSSESDKYLTNHTMWPTAKIKQCIEVTLPIYDGVEDKLTKDFNQTKPTLEAQSILLEVALIVNK